MYRANKNNNLVNQLIEDEEKKVVMNLEYKKRDQVSTGLIMKQMGSLTGLVIGVCVLVVVVGLNLGPASFGDLFKIGREAEILISEREPDIKPGDKIKEAEIRVKPEKMVVLRGELFEVEIYSNQKDKKVDIGFDSRMVLFRDFDKEEGIESEWRENRLGEMELDYINQRESNFVGKMIFEATGEGITEILINGIKVEIRIVEGFWEAIGTREASCSARYLSSPYNLEAKSGPGLGELSLNWEGEANLIRFGERSGNYDYAVRAEGNQRILTGLKPGSEYFIRLFNQDNCGGQVFSDEFKIRAGFGGMTRQKMEDYEGIMPIAEGLLP